MPLSDLLTPPANLSDEDKIAQTAKLVQRTFGVEASQLGEIRIVDGAPVLAFSHNGRDHILSWERDRNSAVVWGVDGVKVPGLGGEGAIDRLAEWLDRK